LHLSKIYIELKEYEKAKSLFEDSLNHFPENSDFLLGLAHLALSQKEYGKALDLFCRTLSSDPEFNSGVLGVGSILHMHEEYDGALIKYRVLEESAIMWNNVGVSFLGKRNFIASISCLSQALMMAPMDPNISFNLGIAYLNAGNYAGAFTHLNASSKLLPKKETFKWLGFVLDKLGDKDNSEAAYLLSGTENPADVSDTNIKSNGN
jgi:Bardet-Biedl syndrome 4 protein